MKRIFWSVILVSFILYSISLGWAQDRPIHIGFTGLNLEQNNLTVMGVGSGEYPLAELSFGYIPSNNAFDDATNGWGAIVNADPGEGIVILAPTVNTDSAALIRCSVRSSGPHVAFALASIGLDENQTVNTTVPNNGAYFVGRYQRLAGVALPPASGFQAMVQVLNTSETEPLIVYIDNFDIYPLSEGYFYHEEFIDGDIVDPPTISLMPGEVVPTATRTPEPTSTPFPNDDPYEPDGYAGQASQFSIFNQLLHNNIRVIDTDYDIDYMTFGFVPKDDAYFQSSPYYG